MSVITLPYILLHIKKVYGKGGNDDALGEEVFAEAIPKVCIYVSYNRC